MRGAPTDSNILGGMPPSSSLSVAVASQVEWLKESHRLFLCLREILKS